MLRKGGCLPQPEVAERINAWWQYSSETNYIDSSSICFETRCGKVVFCVRAKTCWVVCLGQVIVRVNSVIQPVCVFYSTECGGYKQCNGWTSKHVCMCIWPTESQNICIWDSWVDIWNVVFKRVRSKYDSNRLTQTTCLYKSKWSFTYARIIDIDNRTGGIPAYKWRNFKG